MEYLNRVLGIRVLYQNQAPVFMPHSIDTRYRIQTVFLDGNRAFFVYPKGILEPAETVKRHMERIEKTQGAPAVLVLERLAYREKEYFLNARVPFIVEGKQIYLPFLAVYLQERADGEDIATEAMLPSSQLLLLWYIYRGCGEMSASEAGRDLSFTATSVSRASRQLEEMGLIWTEKRGVRKMISSGKTPEELFYAAKDRMRNPVKRRIYVPKPAVSGQLMKSGYFALSEYARTEPPALQCFAAEGISAWESRSSKRLLDPYEQYEVELWRYGPEKLAEGGRVDRLSLALSLWDDRNRKVRKTVEEMLDQVWNEIGNGRG